MAPGTRFRTVTRLRGRLPALGRVDAGAAWLIVAATAWWASIALPGSFHQDDHFYIKAAQQADLQDWLGRIYWQHFAPGHRLVFWLLGSESSLSWFALQSLLVAAFAAGLYFFYRSLRLLYGASWWLLIPVAVAGFAWQFSLGFAYPSAGLQIIPEFAFGTLCLYAFLRHLDGGQARWLVVSGVAFTLGLSFYVRMLLVPVLLFAVRYLILERDLRPRAIARAIWSDRAQWLVFLLPAALYLRYFWQHSALEAPAPDGIGQLLEFARIAWTENVVPGFLGVRLGPSFALTPASPPTLSGPSATALAIAAQLVVLVLFAVSLARSRPAALRAWTYIGLAVGLTFWMTARGKVGVVGASPAANDPRYVANLCWQVPLGVVFALHPRTVLARGPTAPSGAGSPAQPRGRLAIAIAALVGIVTAVGMNTARSVDQTWQDQSGDRPLERR